jgi:hypothetical protein
VLGTPAAAVKAEPEASAFSLDRHEETGVQRSRGSLPSPGHRGSGHQWSALVTGISFWAWTTDR